MNKIIPTYDRIFMAVVGPSGSGKTQLIFKMLVGNTFYPKFDNMIFFYKEFQPLYSQMKNKLPISFVRFTNLEFISELENSLIIFDDSCEEIYNDPQFVQLATAGRHKNLNVIYVKHNLYQQSKYSRTIDLNTSHIILFKSPRDVQQVNYLGRQLSLKNFLNSAYQIAVKDTFGHLLIDLDPKTSDCLRYCSNITPPGPTVFYLTRDDADITPLTNEREKTIYATALSAPLPQLSSKKD